MAKYTVGFSKKELNFKEEDLPIGEFTRIARSLTARSIVARGEQTMVIVSLELTSLPPQRITELRQLIAQRVSCSSKSIWITVTHSFSSPHVPSKRSKDPHRYDVVWSVITQTVLQVVEAALADQQDCSIAQAVGSCPINVNRDVERRDGWWLGPNYTGPANHDVRILALKNGSDSMGIIVNYDLQSSVFDHLVDDDGQRFIDDDLVGRASDMLEQQHPEWVAMFMPGAAGNQMPLWQGQRNNSQKVNETLCEAQAQVLAESVQQALNQVDVWSSLQTLKHQLINFSVPSQRQQQGTFDIRPTRQYTFIPSDINLQLSLDVWTLNQTMILGTQPELNSEFADECRQVLGDKQLMIATLVNGAAKYLPTESDFARITYQAMNTSIGRGADKVFLRMVKQLKEERQKQ